MQIDRLDKMRYIDKGENIWKLFKESQIELFWHGTFLWYWERWSNINTVWSEIFTSESNAWRWFKAPVLSWLVCRRLPQLHNYWPVVAARQKLTRFVRSEGFLLLDGTQPWISPKSATHARIGGRGTLYTLYSCCSNLREAETQKSKFASRRSPLFRVRVPSPQNYAMVKRVSSNLVILVSLAQRQVFSWSSYTQGPNSQHRAMMAWRPNLELFPKSFITLPPLLNPAKARRCFLYFLLLSIGLVQWMMISLRNSLHHHKIVWRPEWLKTFRYCNQEHI